MSGNSMNFNYGYIYNKQITNTYTQSNKIAETQNTNETPKTIAFNYDELNDLFMDKGIDALLEELRKLEEENIIQNLKTETNKVSCTYNDIEYVFIAPAVQNAPAVPNISAEDDDSIDDNEQTGSSQRNTIEYKKSKLREILELTNPAGDELGTEQAKYRVKVLSAAKDYFGEGTISNPTTYSEPSIGVLNDFDTSNVDALIDSVLAQWEFVYSPENKFHNEGLITIMMRILGYGAENEDVANEYGAEISNPYDLGIINGPIVRKISQEAGYYCYTYRATYADFSEQFLNRMVEIFLYITGLTPEDLNPANAPSGFHTYTPEDDKPSFMQIILSEMGIEPISTGYDQSEFKTTYKYAPIDFKEVYKFIAEYDKVPYNSVMYGKQFNSLKEEMEYYCEYGNARCTKKYFQDVEYNSNYAYSGLGTIDENPFTYMKVPKGGAASAESILNVTFASNINAVLLMNKKHILSESYAYTTQKGNWL